MVQILSIFYMLLVASISLQGMERETVPSQQIPSKNSTILIHGTLFPIVSYYYHGVYSPAGACYAKEQPTYSTLGRIASLLATIAPEEFPLDSFYLYGWSGKLTINARLEAARSLYKWICKHCKEPLTIIGHSHGATIALYLAKIAEEENNYSFTVDRLVLISCPVQENTCTYITSPLFKKIYHLYSATDFAQICDPQRFSYGIPVLSERIFKPHKNIIQAEILLNNASPGHNDFLLKEAFIKQLPSILTLLDKQRSIANEIAINHFIISIMDNNDLLIIPKQPHIPYRVCAVL